MNWGTEKSLRYPAVFCLASIKTSINSKNVMKFQNIMAVRDREPKRYLTLAEVTM